MGLHTRRRSVDVGGLALALGDEGRGHGWGGWEEIQDGETRYAEVLIDVRAHTETIVNSEPVYSSSPMIAVDEETRRSLIKSLDSWHFEPHKLPEEQILVCTYILFEALFRVQGMQEAIGVSLSQIAAFLQHLRQLYRQRNTYHNFQHALDVFQATYYFLYTAGIVPPVSILLRSHNRLWQRDKHRAKRDKSLLDCLAHEDIFALYIATVGHDVGHPGLTNAFLRNAKTPLAELFENSTLEQMHYSLIMQLMRHHGLGTLLDRPKTGPSFRKLLAMTVLATDMSVHAEFMRCYKEMVNAEEPLDLFRQKVLVCQALIKCADISNPSRPHVVSQHWAAALEAEWTSQLMLEQHLDLPTSVRPSKDALSEAKGQVFFTSHFTYPLLELTASGIPQMGDFARQCKDNLKQWEARCAALSAPEKHSGDPPLNRFVPHGHFHSPEDFLSAFPPTLPRDFLREHVHSVQSSDRDSAHEYFDGSSASPPGSRPSTSGSDSSAYSHYHTCSSTSPSPPHFRVSFDPMQAELPQPIAMPTQLPRLEITKSPAASIASAGSNSSSLFINTHDATSAIRAAYKASVRKKKSFHRTSWNPSPSEYHEVMNAKARAAPSPKTASPLANSPNLSNSTSTPSTLSPLSSVSSGSNSMSPLSPRSISTTSTTSPITPESAIRSASSPGNTLLSTLVSGVSAQC
ncbi:3',5'-cyclic-nucleotide phosphodiesterase [Phanerochaete sordida]|uniref:Phosphodiesterase n=1 Tax=Phanerochaete sordida TaxID=48140 RepID=A0A9P3LJC4_9APHY|nr:3',5'-cyclic-nucleotide phosphodiesterase [Phanerochaete sordida]